MVIGPKVEYNSGSNRKSTEAEISKPKNNLPYNEIKAIKELKDNPTINIKKADKGSTTVIMNKLDKIAEGQIQLDDVENYRPLATPMVEETHARVERLITELHHNDHIDTMTRKWLANPVGRPIISGCGGPTERISSFVDSLLQPIAKQQTSYLKDTTDFINFIENTKVTEDAILVSMDVTSLYTNIPQEEGITTVCNTYERFHSNKPPIPTHYLREMLRLILQENSFQFHGKHYLQTHGTAMGTKMAVSFANLFMAAVETEILSNSTKKPLVWKRYIDDVFSLWNIGIEEINGFIEQANRYHPTMRFTAEISAKEIIFLDTCVYKGDRFNEHLSLMCELTTNRLKRFSTRNSLPTTHQGSVKVSSKAKHLGCFELTLLKRPLMSTSDNSNHAYTIEAIQIP